MKFAFENSGTNESGKHPSTLRTGRKMQLKQVKTTANEMAAIEFFFKRWLLGRRRRVSVNSLVSSFFVCFLFNRFFPRNVEANRRTKKVSNNFFFHRYSCYPFPRRYRLTTGKRRCRMSPGNLKKVRKVYQS